VPHDHNPTQSLQEQIAERLEVRHCPDRVRNQLDLVAMLGDKPPHKQVISRSVFNRLIAPKLGEPRARGSNRGPQGEFHAIELPRNHDPWIEIRVHTSRLQLLHDIGVFCRRVETGDCTYFRISQGCDYRTQVTVFCANVAVVDD